MYSVIVKNRCEKINLFRISVISQQSTSVDIEEVVKSGGFFDKILEGFRCDNLEINPFERFFIDMTDKRNNFKQEKKIFLQSLTKKFLIQ